MQQTYGLDIDRMGVDYTTLHAAALVAQLPEGSRLARAVDPDNEWTLDRVLMATVASDLNWLVWSQTKDAHKHGSKPPKPIGPSWVRKGDDARQIKGISMTKEQLMAELARAHGEVDDG